MAKKKSKKKLIQRTKKVVVGDFHTPKSPVLAAILNILIPGAGYVYIKQRLVFGWLVLLSTVIGLIAGFYLPQATQNLPTITWISTGIIYAAFGYDAYDLASK